MIEGKGRKKTIIPTVVNTSAVLIAVVIVIIADTFVGANPHPSRLASEVGVELKIVHKCICIGRQAVIYSLKMAAYYMEPSLG